MRLARLADRLLLYARTLSHLKAGQMAYLVLRRMLPRPRIHRARQARVQCRPGIAMRALPAATMRACAQRGEFQFLNVSKSFGEAEVDWASPDMSKLWRYNLHYFDYILDAERPVESVCSLISEWIQGNPFGQGVGWEPYPTSLRIVNWIKLFLRKDFSAHVQEAWLDSLYAQSLWLEKNVEYHLLANHLLKNGKALFFSGVFFSGADAECWLQKGLKILVEEAREQILGDGGHFERSPMYHCIVVEDYLDALNLMIGSAAMIPFPERDFLAGKARAALDFLHDICKPDGSIPLFNDSALHIAPAPEALVNYARQVIDYRPSAPAHGLSISAREATGYFVMRNGGDMLIVDCGEVGPGYQPGHAHCDTLSFELSSEGRALIVDSGVYDYEDSEMRRYVRGTRAHNTATIDGCEQSELWGVFRVARRARPTGAKIEKLGESRARFSGSHDGFARLPGVPRHTRDIEYQTTGEWTIFDSFSGTGEHRMDTFIHLHPDLAARVAGRAVHITHPEDGVVAELQLLGSAEIVLENGWYCPEFGKRQENAMIRLSLLGMLPQKIGYRIVKRSAVS